MSLPHPVPDELVELIARRFRAIGEPMRIKLLDRLRDGEATVNELSEAIGASQQNVSKHLALLAEAGILGRRKDGNRVYYRIVGRRGVQALRGRLRLDPGAARVAERAGRGGALMSRRWPLERVLFALAGSITLVSVLLAAIVSPWFLLLTAFVGVNQWLYVVVGGCPASVVLERFFGIDRRCSS